MTVYRIVGVCFWDENFVFAMLISNGNLTGGNDFSSVAGLSGCCPVPVTPSRGAIVNWKMDPVGLPAPNTAPMSMPPTGRLMKMTSLTRNFLRS